MKLQDDEPIFMKQKVNFLPPDKILHLRFSNNFIVIAVANNSILRINTKNPDPESMKIVYQKTKGIF